MNNKADATINVQDIEKEESTMENFIIHLERR